MNIEFAKKILIERIRRGDGITQEVIKDCFDVSQEFMKNAVEYGYYIPKHCPECESPLSIINIDGSTWRAQCQGCSIKANGTNEHDAIMKLWSRK